MSEGAPTASRLDWIEAAKGVGVTSVILVHSIIPTVNPITQHLSSFTIPLFFVLAGFTYNNERHRNNLRSFALSRGLQFLIPYFFLYAIVMVLFVPLSPNIDTYLTPGELVFWFVYGNGPPLSASHLWFLPVLYFGLMVFVVADRIMQNFSVASRWILAAVFPVLAIIVQAIFAPALVPWRLGGVLLAATFVLFGNMMRHYKGMGPWLSSSAVRDFMLFVLLSVSLVLVSSINGFTDIAVDNFGASVWFYLIAGTIGTVLTFSASSALLYVTSLKRVALALGKNSQEVYEIHPAAFYLVPPIFLALGWPSTDPGFLVVSWVLRFVLGISTAFLLTKYVITRNRVLAMLFRGSQRIASPAPVKETQPAA
ncbi:MAG: acyltransferase family protein [Candidatus Thorarchaeota archaeon]